MTDDTDFITIAAFSTALIAGAFGWACGFSFTGSFVACACLLGILVAAAVLVGDR